MCFGVYWLSTLGLVGGDTQVNKTLLVLRYRQIDDFISVVDIVLPRRDGAYVLEGSLSCPLHPWVGGIDETEMSKGGQKEKQGIRDIRGSVHRGQIRPELSIPGPGEDRYAISICAEVCVTFHA